MTLLQAVLLGVIQGLTEFLPISSTAHLRVVPALAGWPDPGAAFTAVIQIGTLVAVLLYFRHDIARLLLAVLGDLTARRLCSSPDSRLAWMIAAGTVPIVVCGLVFKKQIKEDFRSLYVISAAAIGLAVLLAAAEWLHKVRERRGRPGRELEQVGWADALWVGLWQAVALIPGSSRSGVTITGGLFAGLSRATAARFSFLLSLPSVLAAGVYEFYEERHALLASRDDAINLLAAAVVSGVVGYASIAFLLHFLKTHSTLVFIVYRLVLGAVILVLLGRGVLAPN
jgi:undecaprenyl-diphosphatase